jgi:hypothetical protein
VFASRPKRSSVIFFSRAPPGVADFAIDIGDIDQQGHRREPTTLVGAAPSGRSGTTDLGEKTLQGIEHRGLQTSLGHSEQ